MPEYETQELEIKLSPSELISLLYYYESEYIALGSINPDKAIEAKDITIALKKKIDDLTKEIIK